MKKILYGLIIGALALFLLGSKSYATENTNELPEGLEYKQYSIHYKDLNDGRIYIVTSNKPAKYYEDRQCVGFYDSVQSYDYIVYRNQLGYSDRFEHYSQGSESSSHWGFRIDTLYASNYNIMYSNRDEVFYQALPKETTLKPITEKLALGEVLTPILMILPICLVCLVGWIALRKALATLQTILHKA